MSKIKTFCEWIRGLDKDHLYNVKHVCCSNTVELIDFIRNGDFSGLTFTKENRKKEILQIKKFMEVEQHIMRYTIMHYMNYYNGINYGEFSGDIMLLEDACYNIEREILYLPEEELLKREYYSANRFEDAFILFLIKTEHKVKPDKEELKSFIKHQILDNASMITEVRWFIDYINSGLLDKQYFFDMLLEVAKEEDRLISLYNCERYSCLSNAYKKELNDLLILSGNFDENFIETTLMELYRNKPLQHFIKEILPYNINFIKVLYNICLKVANYSLKHMLNNLASVAYETVSDTTGRNDDYAYCLPLRQLLIIMKSCMKRCISTGLDTKLIGKKLAGLINLCDYDFNKIVNHMYAGKTSIF